MGLIGLHPSRHPSEIQLAGSCSTALQVLLELAKDHAIARIIWEHRKLRTLLNRCCLGWLLCAALQLPPAGGVAASCADMWRMCSCLQLLCGATPLVACPCSPTLAAGLCKASRCTWPTPKRWPTREACS